MYIAVEKCGESLNATTQLQEYVIPPPQSDSHSCDYAITSSPGSSLDVTITDGTIGTAICGDYEVIYGARAFGFAHLDLQFTDAMTLEVHKEKI